MRYLLAWFPMIVIAVANGAAREAWLVPRWLSTMALIVLLGLYMSFVFRRWPLSSSAQAIAVGAMWLALTVAFESGLGWWSGLSWAQMTAEYNLAAGRLWSLVPLWVGVAPYMFFRLTRP